MSGLDTLLAISPVLVIFLLLLLRRTAADVAGLIGWKRHCLSSLTASRQ